jgi:hypothetical protein
MRCPTCNQEIDHDKAWKGAASRYHRRAGRSESISTGSICSDSNGSWRYESNTPLKPTGRPQISQPIKAPLILRIRQDLGLVDSYARPDDECCE